LIYLVPKDSTAKFTQGEYKLADIPEVLLENGKVFGKGHPQYADYAVDQFVSVKAEGAKGDGSSDDTAALQAIFDKVCKIPMLCQSVC
jgi:glucan 1,3-beta-glucosidase